MNLHEPLPIFGGPHQPGITDPQWPIELPAEAKAAGISPEQYQRDLSGRVARQRSIAIATADLEVSTPQELKEALHAISKFAWAEMQRGPSTSHTPVLTFLPDTYRVTVTIGLGSRLFLDEQGNDRFGLNHQRPNYLRTMPSFTGDAPDFSPARDASDLILIVCSDHSYVNVAIIRAFAHGYVDKRICVRRIEQGFDRPDKREFLRFDDGIDNLTNSTSDRELDRMVYVAKGDGEPDWCAGGSYLVYRKILENLPVWEQCPLHAQEGMIGRHKKDGNPLSRKTDPHNCMTPLFPDPTDSADGPVTAHIRKVQPRRPYPDLFDCHDVERRFLRRPYPFFDGMTNGSVTCGLHFIAYMRNLKKQFEWVVQMWQTNPNFPVPNAGIDALYAHKILSNVAGGYYFCPPAPTKTGGFVGSDLFE